jgi:hypothetical protein
MLLSDLAGDLTRIKLLLGLSREPFVGYVSEYQRLNIMV